MSDVQPAMKPQDTVIYLLGELKGQMGSVQATVAASTTAQSAVNAENKKEHEEFRHTLEAHGNELTAIRTASPARVSGWSKAGVLVAIPASAIALVGFIALYLAK